MEPYVPVNFIPDEVYALLAAWELSNPTTAIPSDRIYRSSTARVAAAMAKATVMRSSGTPTLPVVDG